ncbi:hypothetical protein ACWCRD_04360 [Streptomyces sp. NPDC002092]
MGGRVDAAAGSLVSRAEDVSSAVMPVLMAALIPFAVAITAVQDLNAGWVEAIGHFPPFSMLIMPLQVSVNEAGRLPDLLAALLMLMASAALATLSARVHQRSILRIGPPVRRRDAPTSTT